MRPCPSVPRFRVGDRARARASAARRSRTRSPRRSRSRRTAMRRTGPRPRSRSELRLARRARVGQGVADVGQAADIDDQALEAQAETGMRDGAVTTEVPVPAVVFTIQPELRHARVEYVQAFLALA